MSALKWKTNLSYSLGLRGQERPHYLNVFPDELDIYKDSEMLKLPVRGHEEEARRITVEAFTQQTSGRNVRESKF